MVTDPLLERLQRAVAPDYRVERELRGGGQGRVYLAHEVALNRDVAIKVLRPELATTAAAEAFLREARILAGVRHPNIIVIHRSGEGEGLQYYMMELVNGPTLEDRLASAPIPANDAVWIGINLLDGLETVHRLGLVHRDIKPSNVFLLPKRALLGDFGIARPPSNEENDSHSGEGTPEYMAPEQVERKPITPLTDIYSTGVVLYEAVSGRRFHEQGKRVDWSDIPSDLERVLRRAVATQPEDRWPDTGTFRQALAQTIAPSILRPVALVGAGGLVLGALVLLIVSLLNDGSEPPNPDAPTVTFDRIDYVGPTEHRSVADSLIRMVHDDLSRHVNFGRSTVPALVVQARLTVTGGDAGLRVTGGIPASEFRIPFERWPTLRDSLAYQIVLGVWAHRSPLAASLPRRALPRTAEGLTRFLEAERLVAKAEWEEAHAAYLQAEATDPTCWICSWRITEIERWLSREPDPDRVRRVRVHADSLPPLYRSLIRAAQLPLRPRLDTLRAAAEGSREVFLGWFQLGDELFHRGPLAGHGRAEAIPPLERAARLRPDFGPAWEHLAWVATAEGDSADAANALDSLESHGSTQDAFALELRALLHVGFAWRFLPESTAVRITERVANAPATQSSADLGAGPRLLPTFDVPLGAIVLGQILEMSPTKDLKRSGLVAQTFGTLALGRLDDMRDLAHRLTDIAPETELGLFVAQLQAALALLDPDSASTSDAVEGLRPWIASNDVPPLLRDRAIWMNGLLARRSALRPGAPRELKLLLTADSLAAAGQPRAALALLDGVDVDVAARRIDPFFRTIVHFQRAGWRARTGDIAGARRELLWHEHTNVVGLPTGLPQAAEVDWAFGTLARWRLARLLNGARGTERGEACKAYAAVTRHWLHAPAPYGARADTARIRAGQLGCQP
jgi:serine/threonine protein kinase